MPTTKKTAKKTAKKKPAATKKTAKKTAKKKASTKKPAPSTKPLAMKLGILEGLWVIDNPPPGFELLKPPKVDIGVDIQGPLKDGQSVLAFVVDREDVGFLAAALKASLPEQGEVKLWIAYPKGGSGVDTDLNRDVGWEPILDLDLEPVAQVAVDRIWSALRFRPTAPF